ncbi:MULTISPECIES: universal stress protein [Streptomyces]|uniref:Universal stress protein n=1 Tax=Streptomyces doudnae TaxID=3075536 RepID=A0ABD5EQV0_9ACTN|nr:MULTISPECIES: universal stress protein [unclassified Streptomyces]MDT0436632.1 universal stress protein [Streptomyces sp. DSM 41981]MYQ65961.1 universal stress protein [Streptomyces sp. SID4950]SCE11197.1 Nucleotide-binding universal stress protein, UspA family [Streptomyces sp. SolWspMP-5a-2]
MSTLPVIAAVDGSDNALRALDWAVDAARGRGAPLRVVHVRQNDAWAQPGVPLAPVPDPDDDTVVAEVRRHLDGVPDRPVMEYLAVEGAPGAILPELGATAQLLVLGSRGRGGFASLLLGSNGMAASRDADCPVVVVPPPGREVHGDGPGEPGPRVVVGLKVDSPDDATLAFAFTEAERLGARVHAVAAYTWPVQTVVAGGLLPPTVDQDAIERETRTLAEGSLAPHRERHPRVRTDVVAAPGDAAGLLVAASAGADLVVVGRHRRRLLAPARLLGSVTQAVLLHAASPIAVVPPAPEPGEE